MTYWPALDDFDGEDVPRSVARVYKFFRKDERLGLVLYEARPVKIAGVARALGMQPSHTSDAIHWLIDHGYVVETGRDGKLLLLVLAWRRQPPSQSCHLPAA